MAKRKAFKATEEEAAILPALSCIVFTDNETVPDGAAIAIQHSPTGVFEVPPPGPATPVVATP